MATNQHQKTDSWYIALLGLSETFRTASPPKIKHCIHCLQSILQFKPPPHIEARTHLQMGSLLFTHTKNIDLARTHLEKAWAMAQSIPNFDEVKFEAASLLASIHEQQTQLHQAKQILRKAISISQQAAFWRCRLLFQLAQIHAHEKDFESACDLLRVGADYAVVVGSVYTQALFLLSQGVLLLVDKKYGEVDPVLTSCGTVIGSYQGTPTNKESLKVYFLVLQVCHYLMAGQVKSVKPALKQLQQAIQSITVLHTEDEEASNPADQFHWLPKEHMCVLVYLVTVMHSMQAGYMDKAQKYTDKALLQISKLKILDSHPILSSFQLMLLEHIIMCRLVMGQKALAVQEISQACQVCSQNPRLFNLHRAQLHTLLGLYSMSMNCMESAEAQFNTALKQLTTQTELWQFISLNLAIVYLRSGNRQQELISLLERVNPETTHIHAHSLKAAGFYVKGLQAFFQAKYSDAKRFLRETLKMANEEDLNRLTACSLVLLGHIFLSLGNNRESQNMVLPAMQLAGKIPDMHIQLWASALLRGDPVRQSEGYQMHSSFSQQLLSDHFQSSQQPEHNLIHWTDGPIPPHLLQSEGASTSIL